MREVVYHPRVPPEVRDIIEYYEGISVPLADEFWEELTSAIQYARNTLSGIIGMRVVGGGAI